MFVIGVFFYEKTSAVVTAKKGVLVGECIHTWRERMGQSNRGDLAVG